MYEYEVLLKNGNRTFIWGRDYDDALCRHPETAKERGKRHEKENLLL